MTSKVIESHIRSLLLKKKPIFFHIFHSYQNFIHINAKMLKILTLHEKKCNLKCHSNSDKVTNSIMPKKKLFLLYVLFKI